MEDLLKVESAEQKEEEVRKLPTYTFSFIWSKDGFFKIVEVILGIIVAVMLPNTWTWYRILRWISFGFNFVVLCYTIGSLVAALVKTHTSSELWTEKLVKLDYTFNIVCFVFSLVAFILVMVPDWMLWQGGPRSLLTLCIFFFLHCLRSYRIYKGRYPWGGKSIMKALLAFSSKMPRFGTNNYFIVISQDGKKEVVPVKLSEFEERVRVGMI